ncbi:MAG: TIGR03862 family flavoprotein, partial [Rhizomicrobium sp.]
MTRAHPTVAVIGGGPAGLMAAEVLSARGIRVTIYDRMPSLGRKLLMAGRGGLNLTHSEPIETFLRRYGRAADALHPALEAFPPSALIAWANGLGQETFVGSSGRVFPKAMKASPLLRAWLARLAEQGVQFRARHTWRGWDESGALVFLTPHGAEHVQVDATLLALGGASWPRLGSDGGWQSILAERDVQIVPLAPANCGFTVSWS